MRRISQRCEKRKVFMIVSDSLRRKVMLDIHNKPQLEAVYVFCSNKATNEEWANKIAEVKGVFTEIEPIYEALRKDQKDCDRNMTPVTFSGLDPLFIYTQFLKETLLEIEDDDKRSIAEFVAFCRNQTDVSENAIALIEKEYWDHTPIWWYTGPLFVHSIVNCAL